MLYTLEQVGAVARVDGSTEYRIGDGLGQLAAPLDMTASLVVSIKPHLAQLASTLGEAAGFSVPEGYAMHYLDQVDSPRPIQVRDYSGSLAPLHLASAGLCVMASWPEAELARYLSRPLERNTPQSVVDPEAIRRRLVGIRESGYAWVHEEFAEGLSSVAAPIARASRGRGRGDHGPRSDLPIPGRCRPGPDRLAGRGTRGQVLGEPERGMTTSPARTRSCSRSSCGISRSATGS